MNLRELAGFDGPYWSINREERNVVALLYAALLQGEDVLRFLRALDLGLPVDPDEVAVYVEYAFLRDIWAGIGRDNARKREVVTGLLAPRRSGGWRRHPRPSGTSTSESDRSGTWKARATGW